MSCDELLGEAKQNERADLFSAKSEDRPAADRQAAKQDLKMGREALTATQFHKPSFAGVRLGLAIELMCNAKGPTAQAVGALMRLSHGCRRGTSSTNAGWAESVNELLNLSVHADRANHRWHKPKLPSAAMTRAPHKPSQGLCPDP